MSTILGLDLGKFKSVACLYDTETTAARFTTIHTDPADLRTLLEAERPALVVFETCTVAGWVAGTETALCGGQPDARGLELAQGQAQDRPRRRPEAGPHGRPGRVADGPHAEQGRPRVP